MSQFANEPMSQIKLALIPSLAHWAIGSLVHLIDHAY
jgi:hypothetical protein